MFCCVILSLSLSAGADGEVVRLINGQEILGTIEAFDDARGITMRRFDNGGKIDLAWGHIAKEDAKRIREGHGFYDDEAQPILIDATRLVFAGEKEQIGLIIDHPPDAIVLKQPSGPLKFPLSSIRRVEPVKVDALRVYTSDELYQKRISDSPPGNAQEQYYTGVYCESIRRFDLALEHYKAASAADTSFKPKEVIQKIAICTYKVEKREQTDRLDEIKQLFLKRSTSSFKRAFERCKDFETDFANSQLKPELEKIRTQGNEQYKQFLTSHIGIDFLSLLDKETQEIVAKRDLTLPQALAQMRDQVTQRIFDQLAKNYETDVDLVKQLFPNRSKSTGKTASYGGGTFILKDTALEGMKEDKSKQAAKGQGQGKDKADAGNSLEDRIGQIIKERQQREKDQRERGRKKGAGAGVGAVVDIPPKPEEWWMQATTPERHSFLLAFYAEKAKDHPLEVVKIFPRPCMMCQGEGGTYVVNPGQGQVLTPCSRCKTLRVDRVITFR